MAKLRNERWTALAIVLFGVLNVTAMIKLHYAMKILGQMTEHQRAYRSSHEATQSRLESGQIRVLPETEAPAVRRAVNVAALNVDSEHRVYNDLETLTKRMAIGTIVLFGLQIATAVWWALRRHPATGA